MLIRKEMEIRDFKAWSGGKFTLDYIIENNKCDELEMLFEELAECRGELFTETEINDILWFEDEMIFEYLGLNNPYEEEQ